MAARQNRPTTARRCLLIDISNTFTKLAPATRRSIGRPVRIPTPQLSAAALRRLLRETQSAAVVLASVVPAATARIRGALPHGSVFAGPHAAAGIVIKYPKPATIGPDRIANAVACLAFHGAPAVVVDFGTAVTFDVIDADGAYIGGVIAPGLGALVEYLHCRTALLPKITLCRPRRAVGRTTREAMLSGAVHGYRGMVAEILERIAEDEFNGRRPAIVATGGDAALIGEACPLFDHIDQALTLKGLHIIARHHLPKNLLPG